MLDNNARRSFVVTALIVFAATAFALPSWAQAKLPSTPEEHFALARKYKDKAEEYSYDTTSGPTETLGTHREPRCGQQRWAGGHDPMGII